MLLKSIIYLQSTIFSSQLSIINWFEQHQLPCLFKQITGIECPGCGFQRSLIELLKGNLISSFQFYPALMPMLIFFLALWLNDKFRWTRSSNFSKIGIASIFIIILLSYFIKLI